MENSIAPILKTIQSSPTPDWALVLGDTLAAFDCPTGTLHRLDAGSQILKLVSQRGLPEIIMPMVTAIPVGKGMAGICAQRREAVQTCNLQTDDTGAIRPGAKETRMEGAITVPILHNGNLLGTLGIAKPIPYDFNTTETEALLAISNAIGASWA